VGSSVSSSSHKVIGRHDSRLYPLALRWRSWAFYDHSDGLMPASHSLPLLPRRSSHLPASHSLPLLPRRSSHLPASHSLPLSPHRSSLHTPPLSFSKEPQVLVRGSSDCPLFASLLAQVLDQVATVRPCLNSNPGWLGDDQGHFPPSSQGLPYLPHSSIALTYGTSLSEFGVWEYDSRQLQYSIVTVEHFE